MSVSQQERSGLKIDEQKRSVVESGAKHIDVFLLQGSVSDFMSHKRELFIPLFSEVGLRLCARAPQNEHSCKILHQCFPFSELSQFINNPPTWAAQYTVSTSTSWLQLADESGTRPLIGQPKALCVSSGWLIAMPTTTTVLKMDK